MSASLVTPLPGGPRRWLWRHHGPLARAGLQPIADDHDLRRLRLHGLIQRLPHSHTYVLTPEGVRVAVFYAKVHGRLLRPLVAAADQPPAPLELRRALATIDRVIRDYADRARLGAAA